MSDTPVDADLPSLEESYERVYNVAKQVAKTRESGVYDCPKGEGLYTL